MRVEEGEVSCYVAQSDLELVAMLLPQLPTPAFMSSFLMLLFPDHSKPSGFRSSPSSD